MSLKMFCVQLIFDLASLRSVVPLVAQPRWARYLSVLVNQQRELAPADDAAPALAAAGPVAIDDTEIAADVSRNESRLESQVMAEHQQCAGSSGHWALVEGWAVEERWMRRRTDKKPYCPAGKEPMFAECSLWETGWFVR
ncbi:MAG: hypothetical protein Q9212_003600 [Teloschistes hypoglaucus]